MQLISEGVRDLVLVHGEVIGQGRIAGIAHSHCWLELDDRVVIDVSNGKNVVCYKDLYYQSGGIGDNLHRYDFHTYRRRLLEHGHFGPWDLVTSTGL